MYSASSHEEDPPVSLPACEDSSMSLVATALLDMQRALNHQTILIAQLQDELSELRRHNEWYHAQFSQMFRVVARDVRELRATLICSLIEEGPITVSHLLKLLRQTSDDDRLREVGPTPSRAN